MRRAGDPDAAPGPAGYDLLPVLQGKAKSPREALFWQRRTDRAARVGAYKWVDSTRGSGLFDVTQDIGEQADLSRTRPELLAQVRQRWEAWRKQMDESEPRGPFRDY